MKNVTVSIDKDRRVATVTLEKHPLNICDQYFYKEIAEAFSTVNKTKNICAVILRSACKHFCCGGSLEEIQQCSTEENINIISGAAVECMEAIYNCKYPVIGAIQGKAIGAGAAMAACCDVCIATEDAMFSVPEITAGYIGASEFLQMVIPHRHARYYIFTGEPITAAQMKHWGAVLDVVPSEQLINKANEIADKIAKQSPLALEYFKAAMNHNDDERLREKYMHEATYTLKYNGTSDCKETFVAFKERRKPVFTGN